MKDFDHAFHIVRHPLSMLVSAYYSHLHSHPIGDWMQRRVQRELLTHITKREGLLATLSLLESLDFSAEAPGPFLCLKEWDFGNSDCQTLLMEDVTNDPGTLIDKLSGIFPGSNFPIDPKEFSFETIAGRAIGDVDVKSHYRSGDPNSWKKEIPPDIAEYLLKRFAFLTEKFYPS